VLVDARDRIEKLLRLPLARVHVALVGIALVGLGLAAHLGHPEDTVSDPAIPPAQPRSSSRIRVWQAASRVSHGAERFECLSVLVWPTSGVGERLDLGDQVGLGLLEDAVGARPGVDVATVKVEVEHLDAVNVAGGARLARSDELGKPSGIPPVPCSSTHRRADEDEVVGVGGFRDVHERLGVVLWIFELALAVLLEPPVKAHRDFKHLRGEMKSHLCHRRVSGLRKGAVRGSKSQSARFVRQVEVSRRVFVEERLGPCELLRQLQTAIALGRAGPLRARIEAIAAEACQVAPRDGPAHRLLRVDVKAVETGHKLDLRTAGNQTDRSGVVPTKEN